MPQSRELPLRINFYPISYMKLQMYASMDVGMKKQTGLMGGTGGELDEVKRMLIETNPYLLLLTVIVSCLHSAFEMLAFKNGKLHISGLFFLVFDNLQLAH